jgi:hypothetical protein
MSNDAQSRELGDFVAEILPQSNIVQIMEVGFCKLRLLHNVPIPQDELLVRTKIRSQHCDWKISVPRALRGKSCLPLEEVTCCE